ncbi:hypothetical protein AB0910_19210 [Streptomyces sp. NPDC047002]|uniref:hypothetical protein n=1 Tax=Streptomyces sp. NPDC047002 TaxID=3155475 RepID=UPI00345291DB
MTSSTALIHADQVPVAGGRGAAPPPTAPPGTLSALRTDAYAALHDLDAAAKGRASIVRSCSEMEGLSESDRESLKYLLRSLTEQRKRLRALRRLWQSLDDFERPSADLVEATQLCMRESSELASALDPWRLRTIGQVARSVSTTWTLLAGAADKFRDPAPAAGHADAAGTPAAGEAAATEARGDAPRRPQETP